MDVIDRVREVNEAAQLTEEQISRARFRVLRGIDAGAGTARMYASRRPTYLVAGGLVGVAGLIAAVLVVNSGSASSPRVEPVPAPTASPESTPAATYPTPSLETGAGTGTPEPFANTEPNAGQYLKISSRAEVLLFRGPEGTAYQWLFRHPTNALPYSALVVEEDHTVYVPADRTSEWVQEDGPGSQWIRAYPEPQTAEDRAAWESLVVTRSSTSSRAAGGHFEGQSAPIDFADYPTDAGVLWERMRQQYADRGADQDEWAVQAIIGVLRSNLAPASLRGTFVQALEISGRSTVASVDGSHTTYAVDYTATGSRRETISIDARTGWATEFTLTTHRDDGGLVPAEVPDVRFVLSQEIVDVAP